MSPVTAPDASASAFDPRKPFRCRDGQAVTKFGPANANRWWMGQVNDVVVVWLRPNGNWRADKKPHPLDLVNVEPAPDASAFDLDELLRLAEVAPEEPTIWVQNAPSNSKGSDDFYRAARNAIPLLPAYLARVEAEARRKALKRIEAIIVDQIKVGRGAGSFSAGDVLHLVRALIEDPTP